ncbi:MAG: hypothetical protein WC121_13880 [Candidatus Kapaibacterium sp.]|jgi:hypothetical protein
MSTGTNFGLNDSLEYTEFELDSWDCLQSYNSQYTNSNWPKFLLGKPLNNVAAIKILEAQIPFSYYVFNTSNNTFQLQEFTSNGSVPSAIANVVIPPGNYFMDSFPDVLALALEDASPNNFLYAVTYSAVTQKLTIISGNNALSNYFTLTFGSNYLDKGVTNPRIMLGFNAAVNNSHPGNGSLDSQNITAPMVAQITGPNYIYINSRTLGPLMKTFLPGNGIVNPTGAGADGPHMAKLPMTVNPNTVFNWIDPNPLMWFDVGNTTFSGAFDFYITLGTNETPLDFNGNAFSLKLGVLTNSSSHNDYLGGGKEVERVMKRVRGSG